MAKKPKANSNVDSATLQAIANTPADRVFYITKEVGMPLVTAGLVEVNTEMVDENGNAAARLTEAGRAALATLANAPAAASGAATPSPYAIIKGAVLPPSKRGGKGGGAPMQYPFETMEIGDSFFVPVSEKHADPVKTLGSTVSSMNQKYAEDTGATKTVTRTKRGEGNKAVLNADGSKAKEEVTVPVYKLTRKFTIRAVKAGVKYGEYTAPADGALIARVELPVA